MTAGRLAASTIIPTVGTSWQWASTRRNVTITAGQTISVTAQSSPYQGATNTGLAFWAACYSAPGATTPNSPTNSWMGGKHPVTATANVSVHDVFIGLAAGSYDVGICAWLTVPTEWSTTAPGSNTYSLITTEIF